MKMYIATTVDTGDSCDGRARTIGVYFSREDAEEAVRKDMIGIMAHLADQGKYYIQGNMSVETADGDMGFTWNIEEKDVTIPKPSLNQREKAEAAARSLMSVVNDYDSTGLRIVLDKMLNEHRTIEQMFTNRFIIPFVRKMAERYDNKLYDPRNEMACKACKAMWEGLKQAWGFSDGDIPNLPMI